MQTMIMMICGIFTLVIISDCIFALFGLTRTPPLDDIT